MINAPAPITASAPNLFRSIRIKDNASKLNINLIGCHYWTDFLSLDKEQTSYDDLHDGLRLSLKGYNIT